LQRPADLERAFAHAAHAVALPVVTRARRRRAVIANTQRERLGVLLDCDHCVRTK
jgi:hypothetical protein